MARFPNDIAHASRLFDELSGHIVSLIDNWTTNTQSPPTLPQFLEGIRQFLAIATQLNENPTSEEVVDINDVNQLGDYGLNLLIELDAWVTKNNIDNIHGEIKQITLAVTDWILRHQGTLQTLEPIVEALAYTANHTTDATALKQIAIFSGTVLDNCEDLLKNDLEGLNPGHPWPTLHINRAITATRSHNPELMDKVFTDLVSALPEHAPRFFHEGMREMDKLGYPIYVREVMQKYFDKFTRPKMN